MSMEFLDLCDRLGEKGYYESAGILRRAVLKLEIDGKIPKFLNLPLDTRKDVANNPKGKESDQDAIDIMAKARVEGSPYLDIKELRKLERDYIARAGVRNAIEKAIADIVKNGDEAISHLCLRTRAMSGIRQAKLSTINELEVFVDSDTFLRFRNVGPKHEIEIRDNLQLFQERRLEFQSRQNQRTSGYVEICM